MIMTRVDNAEPPVRSLDCGVIAGGARQKSVGSRFHCRGDEALSVAAAYCNYFYRLSRIPAGDAGATESGFYLFAEIGDGHFLRFAEPAAHLAFFAERRDDAKPKERSKRIVYAALARVKARVQTDDRNSRRKQLHRHGGSRKFLGKLTERAEYQRMMGDDKVIAALYRLVRNLLRHVECEQYLFDLF